MNPTFAAGTLPCWEHPLKLNYSKNDVDMLRGTLRTPTSTELRGGDLVPGYSGMIIFTAELTTSGISHKWVIDAQGSLDNSSPTKVINRGQRRTLDEGWDERTRRIISWLVEPKSITGTASTDVIACTAHGFSNGQQVLLPQLTGGAGLVASSYLTLGTTYFIINAATDSFKLSLTSGGAAVDFTSDITAGSVLAAEFALGSPHPDHPLLYLADIAVSDEGTDWHTADLTYRGLESQKPYKRRINGAVTSSNSQFDGYTLLSSTIWEDFPPVDSTTTGVLSGTDIDVEYDSATLSLSDTYLSSDPPPTDKIGQFWTPPDAPDVSVFSLSGTGIKYFYPFGWKCTSMPAEQLPGTDIWLITVNYTYQPISIPTTAAA